MSRGKGREESALKTQALGSRASADEAIRKVETVDPLEQRRRARVTKILDWNDNPTSVRDFPDQAGMALYADSKAVTDEGRVGKGYGTLADGGNATYAAALGKEQEMERDLAASGRLENFVSTSLMGAKAEAGDLTAASDAREMAVAGMRNSNANADQDRHFGWLTRPKQPSFLKQMALGFANSAGTALMAGV